VTDAEILALLNRPKLTVRWSGWASRGNHSGSLIGIAELVETTGVTIPGVTIQLEVKEAVAVDSCLFLFSVMHFSNRMRRRLYQLEVAPAGKRTHNGPTPLYGPHEHIGSMEPSRVTAPDVNCGSWGSCLAWFFTRVSITPLQIDDPFSL
jgi:hypothetical protein